MCVRARGADVRVTTPSMSPLTFAALDWRKRTEPASALRARANARACARADGDGTQPRAAQTFALRVTELEEYRRRLREYLNARMHSVRLCNYFL